VILACCALQGEESGPAPPQVGALRLELWTPGWPTPWPMGASCPLTEISCTFHSTIFPEHVFDTIGLADIYRVVTRFAISAGYRGVI
jgi:hypothetical protein